MTRRRAAPSDGHLDLISYRDIEGAKRELARAILDEGADQDAFKVLQILRDHKMIREPMPYLDVREDRVRRVVVIRHNLSTKRVEESTEIEPPEGVTDANTIPEAVAELGKYADEWRFREQAENFAKDILISTVMMKYLDLLDPENGSKEARKARKDAAKKNNGPTSWDYFQKSRNSFKQVVAIIKDMRVGQITDTFGEDYVQKRRKQPKLCGVRDEDGKVVDLPAMRSMIGHLSFVNRALKWFARKYRPAVRIEFRMPEAETTEPAGPNWAEIACAVMFCLGYVWSGNGFLTETVLVNGKWHTRFVKRPYDEVAKYFPVIRVLLIYFLTGTRIDTILLLGWTPLDDRGYIDLSEGWIYRSGRKTARNETKPQPSSELLRPAMRILAYFRRRDERLRHKNKWKLPRGERDLYVVHDGFGRPVTYRHVYPLVVEVFDALGIDFTLHPAKSGGVTAMHRAGFNLDQISFFVGTTEKVLKDWYRDLRKAELATGGSRFSSDGTKSAAGAKTTSRTRPPPPDLATLSFRRLLDPHRLGFRLPLAEPAPRGEAAIVGRAA